MKRRLAIGGCWGGRLNARRAVFEPETDLFWHTKNGPIEPLSPESPPIRKATFNKKHNIVVDGTEVLPGGGTRKGERPLWFENVLRMSREGKTPLYRTFFLECWGRDSGPCTMGLIENARIIEGRLNCRDVMVRIGGEFVSEEKLTTEQRKLGLHFGASECGSVNLSEYLEDYVAGVPAKEVVFGSERR